MRILSMVAVIVLCLFAGRSTAQACKCVPPDFGRSYRTSDQVLHVRVAQVWRATKDYTFYAAVLVDDAYKGCAKAGSRVLIRTAASSATCGSTFAPGVEYVVYGDNVRSPNRWPAIDVNTCDSNSEWSGLSAEHLAFLHSRPVCCGGSCQCTDGSQPVACLVDPCQRSTCSVDGAVCEANYCGGCHAEWYDASEQRVCEDGCDYGDPARRYVARDPQQCMLVKFACEPNERMFSDECGCGCESTVCEPSACGPELGMPNRLCPDGVTMAGPTGRCLRSTTGTCGWEVRECPSAAP